MTDPITRILVPVDFSPYSQRATQYAATLAGQVGAKVELLHVVEDPYPPSMLPSEIYVPAMPAMVEQLVNEASRRLAALRSEIFAHGADAGTCVVVGRAAGAIVERATAGQFDLIVMGTHGRTGFSHAFIGSVAERVVRTARCAVLTVHVGDINAIATAAEPTKVA